MNLFDQRGRPDRYLPARALGARDRGSLVHENLKVRRAGVRRRVRTKAAGLTTPVVVPPREQLVRGGRGGQPRSNLLIEPGLLLIGIVHHHERPEAVRAHVAGHDHEIAWRDFRKKPVLVAERHDTHEVDQCCIVGDDDASVRMPAAQTDNCSNTRLRTHAEHAGPGHSVFGIREWRMARPTCPGPPVSGSRPPPRSSSDRQFADSISRVLNENQCASLEVREPFCKHHGKPAVD